MIFHLGVFLFTLAFYGFLAWVTRDPITPSWSFYFMTAIPLMVLSVAAARHLSGRLISAYLPGVVSFSTPLLLILVDAGFQQEAFIILASGLYYLSLLGIYRLSQNPEDPTARAMQHLGALGSLLFLYAAAYGFYLNFNVPLSLLMLVYFAATAMISFQTLLGLQRDQRRYVLLLSVIFGFVFGQLAWFLQFWPFGYLTTGTATLILYYWLWTAVADTLRKDFSEKRFLSESVVLLVLLFALLVSSPWRLTV